MSGRTKELKSVVDVAVDAISCMTKVANISVATDEVKNRTETLAVSTQEMVASVAEIAGNSENAAKDAEAARSIAASGRNSADKAVSTVHTIAETVRNAAEQVEHLSEASAHIGNILNTIEAIAKQTNLLALNATIEAARAGEAGKGFAVVAGEVKNLANQTAKATIDIRQLIGKLRSDIASIVQTMETSASAVEEGEKVIAETGGQITDISQRAENVTVRMNEIAGILNQQQLAADEISQGVNSIAQLSLKNSSDIQSLLSDLDGTFEVLTLQLKGYDDCKSDQDILSFGRSDHAAFKKRILDGVLGRSVIQPNDVTDHHSCRLGLWYLQAKNGNIGKLPSFHLLDAPHADMHSHGRRALDFKHKGDSDQALKAVLAMDTFSEQVLQILEDLFIEAGQS